MLIFDNLTITEIRCMRELVRNSFSLSIFYEIHSHFTKEPSKSSINGIHKLLANSICFCTYGNNYLWSLSISMKFVSILSSFSIILQSRTKKIMEYIMPQLLGKYSKKQNGICHEGWGLECH